MKAIFATTNVMQNHKTANKAAIKFDCPSLLITEMYYKVHWINACTEFSNNVVSLETSHVVINLIIPTFSLQY